jgi:hypothetical protein
MDTQTLQWLGKPLKLIGIESVSNWLSTPTAKRKHGQIGQTSNCHPLEQTCCGASIPAALQT